MDDQVKMALVDLKDHQDHEVNKDLSVLLEPQEHQVFQD